MTTHHQLYEHLRIARSVVYAFVVLTLALFLAACSSNEASSSTTSSADQAASSSDTGFTPNPAYTDLSAYPAADFSNYDCAKDYQGTYHFVDMTVRDVVDELDKGSTFVLYTGYDKCPWCNSVINYFNDILTERGITAAYIDTRKDPSWQNNMDIDDYDLFVKRFEESIDEDEDGTKHLYVPEIFFVKDGKLIGDHRGTVPSQKEAEDLLTQEQIDEYKASINQMLDQLE